MQQKAKSKRFEWAQIHREEGVKTAKATCSYCTQIVFWPPGVKPKSFLKDQPKNSDSKGYFDWRRFETHEKTPGHEHAVSALNGNGKSASIPNKPAGLQTPRQEFNDIATFFAVEKVPPAKLDQFVKLKRHRGKTITGTRDDARDLHNALWRTFREEELQWCEEAFSLRVGVDEGSDVSVREWLSVVVDCDTNPHDGGFLFSLPHLEAENLSA